MGRSVSFSELVSDLPGLIASHGDATVTGIASDSRAVEKGDLFIAYRGFEADGHHFIESALISGASAIVLSDPRYESTVEGVPWVRVEDGRRACAELAAAYHQHPSRRLLLAAVTGTNGKTTTTFMIDAIARAAGRRAAVIGTLGYGPADDLTDAPRTTPDAIELQSWLRRLVDEGTEVVAAEVSSHSLALSRPWRCDFDVGVFTNLSQDHLDFHDGLDEYLEAKLLLFTRYARTSSKPMVGAINLDDPAGARIARRADCEVIGYGIGEDRDVAATDLDESETGTIFDLHTPAGSTQVRLSLPGRFNVYNALAAAAATHAMGFEPEMIAVGLQSMPTVAGRFERVDAGQPFTIVVDYAHTPEALSNVLTVARELKPERIICVFGCGGDRDPDKRPKMGRIVTERADRTVITSDNPRSEDPSAIIDAIAAGALGDRYLIEPDRRAAIEAALRMARPGDLVLIAGKGHETYQIFADRTIDFDDRKVAREIATELYR